LNYNQKKINSYNFLKAIRQTETSSSGQRRIDEFLANKRSPKKNNPKNLNVNSILPPASVSENERCPICDRLMSIDILETHTQTCIIRNTAAAKELIEKSKLRAKMEAVAKETLFGRKIRDITRARRGEAAPHDSQNSSKSKFIFAPPSENISDILFPQRSSTSEILVTPRRTTPRKRPNVNLIRLDSETTTCPTCGMQMTVTRLENQHKKTCSKSLISS